MSLEVFGKTWWGQQWLKAVSYIDTILFNKQKLDNLTGCSE
ncbi:MAG: hypothetical protein QM539_00275 [Alphaproteobacteria bacterium]|nr:hypothetical protein [Alphaproteobacteria bacterium]